MRPASPTPSNLPISLSFPSEKPKKSYRQSQPVSPALLAAPAPALLRPPSPLPSVIRLSPREVATGRGPCRLLPELSSAAPSTSSLPRPPSSPPQISGGWVRARWNPRRRSTPSSSPPTAILPAAAPSPASHRPLLR